jgi:hypothetical protein
MLGWYLASGLRAHAIRRKLASGWSAPSRRAFPMRKRTSRSSNLRCRLEARLRRASGRAGATRLAGGAYQYIVNHWAPDRKIQQAHVLAASTSRPRGFNRPALRAEHEALDNMRFPLTGRCHRCYKTHWKAAPSRPISPMSDLPARLEALLRLYAAAGDQGEADGGRLAEQLRKDLQLLVSEHGHKAIDTALDELPGVASPSVSLHRSMRPLPTKTGLPRLDPTSWEKGFSDGFRGSVWWPGTGIEPLSYAAGYTEAQAGRDNTASRPRQSPASDGI